jgi:hypothetical protein
VNSKKDGADGSVLFDSGISSTFAQGSMTSNELDRTEAGRGQGEYPP